MKPFVISIGVVAFCACIGCSQSPKEELVAAAKRYDEGTEIMRSIKDLDSYEKAKKELIKFHDWTLEFEKKRKKIGADREKLPPADKEKAEKENQELRKSPEFQKFREAVGKYAKEMVRVSTLPEVGDLYDKEIVNGKSNEPEKKDKDEYE